MICTVMEWFVSSAMAEAAQLRASGNSGAAGIVNLFNQPSPLKSWKAARVIYSDRPPMPSLWLPVNGSFIRFS